MTRQTAVAIVFAEGFVGRWTPQRARRFGTACAKLGLTAGETLDVVRGTGIASWAQMPAMQRGYLRERRRMRTA